MMTCKRLAVVGLCVLGLAGCQGEPRGVAVGPPGAGAKPAGHASVGLPLFVPGSKTVVLPFALETGEESSKFYASISSSSVSVVGEHTVTWSNGKIFYHAYRPLWNNLIFVNHAAGTSQVLLDRKAVISGVWIPTAEALAEYPAMPPHLLLAVSDTDTNGDGLVNPQDAVTLYLTDPAGSTLTRLTPAGMQLQSLVLDPAHPVIYVRLRQDSDGDRNFTPRDETRVTRVDLRRPEADQFVPSEEAVRKAFGIVTR